MEDLRKDIIDTLKTNNDGSFSTQANRKRILMMCVDELTEKYGNKLQVSDLKGRHINHLLRKWKNDNISTGTLKNRMSHLRWLSRKIGNTGLVKVNSTYGIENRKYITNADKSINVTPAQLSQLSPHIRQSVELQKAFGLRREEATKFQPSFALGGYDPHNAPLLRVKPQWSKGGRYREIAIITDVQRTVLADALALAGQGEGSLIPLGCTYKDHISKFERETAAIGIGQTHGLRHLYAQNRYKDLTGFDCPAVGGVRNLSAVEKERDSVARQQISNELGHDRLSVTGIYLGSWSIK